MSRAPEYIIVLKEDAIVSEASRPETYQRPIISSPILRKTTDIPDRVADTDGWEPDEYAYYYENSVGEGYVNPSDIKTIINVDTLVEEELDKLDQSTEEP